MAQMILGSLSLAMTQLVVGSMILAMTQLIVGEYELGNDTDDRGESDIRAPMTKLQWGIQNLGMQAAMESHST